MKRVYVPAELLPALTAAGVKADEFSNVSRLASILSPDDVAFYFVCNTMLHDLIPAGVRQGFEPLVNECFMQDAMAYSDVLKTAISEGILNATKRKLIDIARGRKLCFKLVNENVILFTHAENENPSENLNIVMDTRKFYSEIIRALHGVFDLCEILESKLFDEYLRLTAQQSGGTA